MRKLAKKNYSIKEKLFKRKSLDIFEESNEDYKIELLRRNT
jgi:threonyl-tRNA synthetase